MAKTTDLEVIRKTPSMFTWGVVQDIYDVGPYTVVEACRPSHTVGEAVSSTPRKDFHCYVDGKSLSRSAPTLESALIICFAFKLLGKEQQTDYMAQAAYKLLTP